MTYLPSRPANGESFTEKVIDRVGSEIFVNSIGSWSLSVPMVSPIPISSIPEIATIEPNLDSSTSTLFRPSNS